MEVIDIAKGDHFIGDISKKEVLEMFVSDVIKKYGHVDYLINNDLPVMCGIDEYLRRIYVCNVCWSDRAILSYKVI